MKIKFSMIEITIKTDNESTLERLLKLIATLDFKVVQKADKEIVISEGKENPESSEKERDYSDLPITWAKNPDVMALAGIWADKDIDAGELRQKAWGNRADKIKKMLNDESNLWYKRLDSTF